MYTFAFHKLFSKSFVCFIVYRFHHFQISRQCLFVWQVLGFFMKYVSTQIWYNFIDTELFVFLCLMLLFILQLIYLMLWVSWSFSGGTLCKSRELSNLAGYCRAAEVSRTMSRIAKHHKKLRQICSFLRLRWKIWHRNPKVKVTF